jgi:hypothetical protein
VTSQWPTPAASDEKGPNPIGRRPKCDDDLPTAVARFWPTPEAERDAKSAGPAELLVRREGESARGQPLVEVACHWRTPSSTDSERGVSDNWEPSPKAGEHSLNRQAAMWNTPIAGDAGEKVTAATPRTGLLQQTSKWVTPRARELGQYQYSKGNPNDPTPTLTGQALSHPDPPTSIDGPPCSPSTRSSRRRLNPMFVAWLMGWPPGWTNFACSATGLCLFRALMRSELSRIALPPAAPPPQLDLFS